MDKLEVNGIQVYAYHGCLAEETTIGGSYIVDVSLWANLEEAARSDKLADTIDYVRITAIVVEEMKIRSKLIEHVARRIGERVRKECGGFESGQIRVTKLNPPVDGNVKNVAITHPI